MSETPKPPDPAPWTTWIDRVLDRIPRMHDLPVRRLRIDHDPHRVSVRYAKADLAALRARLSAAEATNEVAWGIIANASGGDWAQQSAEWVAAAERWRDGWFAALAAARAAGHLSGEGT